MSRYLCHAIKFQNIHHQELGSCISEAITQVCDIFLIRILEKYIHTLKFYTCHQFPPLRAGKTMLREHGHFKVLLWKDHCAQYCANIFLI